MQKLEFIKNPNGPVHTLECDGFTISYNDGSDPNPLGPEPSEGETALIPGRPRPGGKYYILNGDWRGAYKELAPSGYEACKAFFDSKRELFGSSWSD